MDAAIGGSAVLFAGWRFDPVSPALSRREPYGEWSAVPLGSRALGILGLLLEGRGEVVSKDRLIRAVWPTTTVEPNNLTVQIATLRRVLDDGRSGESLIQTVPGQGYRLACIVEVEPGRAVAPDEERYFQPAAPDSRVSRMGALVRKHRRGLLVRGVPLVVAAISLWWAALRAAAPAASPLSMVEVSLEDVSGSDTSSAGISSPMARNLAENIASELARTPLFGVPRAAMIAPGPAVADASPLRPRKARYTLRGSLLRLGTATSVDVQLVDAETGAQLWSQRLDFGSDDPAAAQRDVVRRIVLGSGPVILRTEIHRRQQKRPDRPTADDLRLQALLVGRLPPSPQRLLIERGLYERALQLDPSSTSLKEKLVVLLMDSEDYNPSGYKSVLERTRGLVSDIQMAIPNSEMALRTTAQWLHWQNDRCPETIEASRKLADIYPDSLQANRWLAQCLTLTGHAEEALPWAERAISAGVSDAWQFSNFRTKAEVLLHLGRFTEAIAWYRRALAANPDIGAETQFRLLVRIAGAQALDGDVAQARQTMASARALWPHGTARSETSTDWGGAVSPAQAPLLQQALRLAGLRDHADEEADFSVAPIGALQQAAAGYTSTTLPGATTLHTADVARLVAEDPARKMLIIDTVTRNSGRSLPGAIGLRYVGAGGSLSDLAQDHLRQTMQQLTKGDLTMPILTVGWNSECFDGANLTLRLVALGYRNVHWYRGGREAWEASSAPETLVTIQDW